MRVISVNVLTMLKIHIAENIMGHFLNVMPAHTQRKDKRLDQRYQ